MRNARRDATVLAEMRRWNMTTMTLKIDDKKAAALRQKAQRVGLEPEQLLTASIDDLIAQPDTDFDKAVRRVLAKNRKLYRRLA